MSDLQALLDQIDMLEGELLPDWKYNARTGAVIANAYRKVGDKWSCLVAKDIPAEPDGEFIALARTALPQLASVVTEILAFVEFAEKLHTENDEFDLAGRSFILRIKEAINNGMEARDA